MKHLIFVLYLFLSGNAMAEIFEFPFWSGPRAEQDPRFIEMDAGPCGAIAMARVNSIPKHDRKAPFESERVFELDSIGKVLLTWSVPINSMPYALDNKKLLFEYNSNIYSLTAHGAVSRWFKTLTVAESKEVACKLPKEFKGSGYASCWSFEDIQTKKMRTLAFEGICS